MFHYFQNKENAQSSTKIQPSGNLPSKSVNRNLFLEERIFLNKSCTKWISIGVQPMLNGEFVKVARIAESDTKYVSFNHQELKYLFSALRHNRECNGYYGRDEFEPWDVEEHWMDSIAPEEYEDRDKTILLDRTSYGNDVYQLGNLKNSDFPRYILIASSSLKNLFDLEEFVFEVMLNKKTNFVQDAIFNLVERYRKEKKSNLNYDHLKAFLSIEAKTLCGKNFMLYAITRDAFTNLFEYFVHLISNYIRRPVEK